MSLYVVSISLFILSLQDTDEEEPYWWEIKFMDKEQNYNAENLG